MAEKEDDMTSQASSGSVFNPVVDPTKPAMVEPVSRPLHRPSTPNPTTMEDEQPVKEGYNYWSHLPYAVEDEATRIEYLNEIIADLYTCIKAGDFEGGARIASRQIKRWLHLKFKMPKDTRRKLVKLYYDLSLTPGIDPSASDTFSNMFRLLASPRKMPANELTLDWHPLYDELYRNFIRPNADPPVNDAIGKGKDLNHLTRLARYAQKYFPASEIPAILEKVLPEFEAYFLTGAFNTIGLLSLLIPLQFPTEENPPPEALIQNYIPLIFSLWSQVANSSQWNFLFIDLFGVMASRQISSPHSRLGPYGMFTREQCVHMVSSVFRLLGVPVGPVGAVAYSRDVITPDHCTIVRYRGTRTGDELCVGAARWIIYSLTDEVMIDQPGSGEMTSIWGMIESLLQSVESAFHPSNSGQWTQKLAAFVYRLAEKFAQRWTQEQRNKRPDIPEHRRLSPALKRRFVLSLRKVVFMSIYDKNAQASALSRNALAIIAHLEPDLIIPGVLKRFYPSMQGLLEAHRTTASLASLSILMPTISRHKIYRNHVTTLLGLALPGIDPNDLSKTTLSLTFMISTCMLIPLWDLSDEGDHTALASKWITRQMEILETMPGDDFPSHVNEDSDSMSDDASFNITDMSDDDADLVARSSTGGLAEWVTSFFNQIFGFLSNMPDTHKHAKTAEEVLVPMITLAVSTVLQALEPKLFTLALSKMQRFITENVFHNAGEATASICRCFVEIRPEESLQAFLRPTVLSIREEITENGAGKSGRITTTEVLPRDRALLWHLRIFFALMGPRTGSTLIKYLKAPDSLVRDVIDLTVRECRGTMYHYVGKSLINVVSSLAGIYTLGEPLVKKEIADLSDWAPFTDLEKLDVKWHVPTDEETECAIGLFKSAAEYKLGQIRELLLKVDAQTTEQKKSSADWTDELRESLKYLVSSMLCSIPLYQRCPRPEEWDVKRDEVSQTPSPIDSPSVGQPDIEEDEAGEDDDDDDPDADAATGRSHKYVDGLINRPLSPEQTELLKSIYKKIGTTLSDVAKYLWQNRPNDMQAFIELSTTIYCWLHPQGMASINDVRMEMTSSAMFNIRRAAFVVKSLGKGYYPEAILVQRMEMMHRERVSHNLVTKPARTRWQDELITEVVRMTISPYIDVRKQGHCLNGLINRASQGSLYVIIRRYKKWAPLVLPILLEALLSFDIDTVKGALHTLRLSTIEHTLARNWEYTDKYVLSLIEAWGNFDRPSVQNVCMNGITSLGRYNKAKPWKTSVNESVYEIIRPETAIDEKTVAALQSRKLKKVELASRKSKALIVELAHIIQTGKWRLAVNTTGFLGVMLIDRTTILPNDVVALFMDKMNDPHPQMRSQAQGRMMLYFRILSNMGFARNKEELWLRDTHFPNEVIVRPFDHENFTETYIAQLNTPPDANTVFHDQIRTGMFVWPEEFIGYKMPNRNVNLEFTPEVLEQVKALAPKFNREWVHQQLEYLREETSKNGSGLRSPEAYCWPLLFRAFRGLEGSITEDELREEIVALLDDGKQKFRHQATFEVVFALIMSLKFAPEDHVQRTWAWLLPFLLKIFETMLRPDNVGFWRTFLTSIIAWRDPRQAWPLTEKLLEFRLDSSSHEFFQESSRALMLRITIQQYGWRYGRGKEMFREYMEAIIHPYQEVRKEVGIILSTMTSLNRNVSFPKVTDVIQASMKASSTGFPGWVASEDFEENMKLLAVKLEKWRKERTPGQMSEASPYVTGASTILSWWQSVIIGTACMVILPFVAEYILPETLHMMDVKEEVELMSSAASMLRFIGNAPFAPELIPGMVEAIEKISTERRQWHHRLRIMMVIQVFYYRQLFVLSKHDRKRLFDVVIVLLNDSQLEVREAASATLSGMVHCTKFDEKNLVLPLLQRFRTGLIMNPMPKKRPSGAPGSGISTPQLNGINTPPRSGTSTPEGVENLMRLNKDAETLIRRHAAVLGLSSIITAFPYDVPEWMPSTLAFLANRASGDRGMISMSVKKTLGEFKKTHQDTWLMDQKLFNEDELEALEGVFSSNYFA